MTLEVSDQKLSVQTEAQNLVFTILFSLIPLILIFLLDKFLPLVVILHFISSFATLTFSIWILEVIGAAFVPTKSAPSSNQVEEYPLTIIIKAYMPNEKDIILESILHSLAYVKKLDEKSCVLLTYRAPYQLDIEERLLELTKKEPRFSMLKISEGVGSSIQINESVKISKTDYVYLIDADSKPVFPQKNKLWNHLSKKEILQGRNMIRDAVHLLDKIVAVEFSTEYLVSYLSRAYWNGVAYFCGSNGIWHTDTAIKIPHSTNTLIEDVDVSTRAYLEGYQIIIQPNIEAQELAPPTLRDWWNQRKRWAQGYVQVSKYYFGHMLKNHHMSAWKKINWVYMVSGREIVYAYVLLTLLETYLYIMANKMPPANRLYIPFFIFSVTGLAQILGVVIQSYRYKAEQLSFWWLITFAFVYPFYQLLKAIVSVSGLVDEILGRKVYQITSRTKNNY